MGQTHDEITQHLTERLCWEGARRDETRIARRWSRQDGVAGVYRLAEGALLDAVVHFRPELGGMAMRQETHGAGRDRVMVPVVPALLRDGRKPLLGSERLKALPTVLCSAAARMPVVGFNAQQVRAGRPSGSATLAKNIVRVNLRDWEVGFNGAMRAVATAGVGRAKGPGLVDGPELATPQRDSGCGQVSGRLLALMTAG